MRNAFASEITNLAQTDHRVVLLSGDIGNRLFDPYKTLAPDRFINCGVAEANMIGMAAGMAMAGLKPIAYTIAPFISTRCLEQIRIDLCYHKLPVVLVGVGAGLSYASLGATHQALEDLAQLRTLPGMTVICPGDAVEVRLALRAALQLNTPVYLRLGKKGEPVVHQSPPPFQIGKALLVQQGRDAAILSTGNMLPTALDAAVILEKMGVSAQVVSFHTVKPLDPTYLDKAFNRFKLIATLEEHSRAGGLGGAVAEWRCDQNDIPPHTRLVRFGTPDHFVCDAGSQNHHRKLLGLTPEAIAQRIVSELANSHIRHNADRPSNPTTDRPETFTLASSRDER